MEGSPYDALLEALRSNEHNEVAWAQFREVEELVTQWRFGNMPSLKAQESLKRVSQVCQELDLTSELVVCLRLVFAVWPNADYGDLEVDKSGPTPAQIMEESRQIGKFFLSVVHCDPKRQSSAPFPQEPYFTACCHVFQVLLLSPLYLHKAGKEAFIVRMMQQIERFMETLAAAMKRLEQEKGSAELDNLGVAQLDPLLLSAIIAEEGTTRLSDAEVVREWLRRRSLAPHSSPFAKDEPISEWLNGFLLTFVQDLVLLLLDSEFIASALHTRLSGPKIPEDHPHPDVVAESEWSDVLDEELKRCMGRITVLGMAVSRQGRFLTFIASVFEGLLGQIGCKRTKHLTPVLMAPGMTGKWAEVFHRLVERSYPRQPDAKVSTEKAVEVTAKHIVRQREKHTEGAKKYLLSIGRIKDRMYNFAVKTAEMPFYTKTATEFFLRYLLTGL